MATEQGQECLAALLSAAMAEAHALARPAADGMKLLGALTLL